MVFLTKIVVCVVDRKVPANLHLDLFFKVSKSYLSNEWTESCSLNFSLSNYRSLALKLPVVWDCIGQVEKHQM